MRFADAITTREELRNVIAPPHSAAMDKERQTLDQADIGFIGRSPFVIIGSTNSVDTTDVSPRGDQPGFVQVVDNSTLAIPDRKGNRRSDTFENVLQHSSVGLLFMVPGDHNTLRVRGQASIVRDRDLRASMAIDNDIPELVLVVNITSVYFHCTKSINRSKLWPKASTATPKATQT